MTANPFNEWLSEVSADEVLSNPLDLSAEARSNLWTFTLTREQAEAFAPEDVESFVHAVVNARSRQALSGGFPPMLFYCWHDEQAGQLRFCLVSESHGRLSFGCEIERVTDLRTITTSYLRSRYHEGIPWEECAEDAAAEESCDGFVLQVWVTRLPSACDEFRGR